MSVVAMSTLCDFGCITPWVSLRWEPATSEESISASLCFAVFPSTELVDDLFEDMEVRARGASDALPVLFADARLEPFSDDCTSPLELMALTEDFLDWTEFLAELASAATTTMLS